MTFTELRTEIMDRLNLSSTTASTRIGRAINRKYRLITSSIGLQLSRRVTVSQTVTPGVSIVTFTNTEKLINLVNRNISPYKSIDEVTVDELRKLQPYPTSDSPSKYANASQTADTISVEINVIPQTAFALYADVHQAVSDLSGSQEPAFPESFHDIIIEGVISDELRKMEKGQLAAIAQQEYSRILSDLRMWIAKGAMDQYQSKTSVASTRGTSSGGSGSGGINGALSYTQTGLITFDRDPLAPFAVTSSSAVVSNLDADKLDGLHGPTSAIVGINDSQTLTNKTLASPIVTTGAVDLQSGQIKFPAAQSASANVNTLDDYEEGTWTPVIGGSGGTSGQTYSLQAGLYIKIGKLVYATFNVALTTKGTITTFVQVQGLPFATETTTNVCAIQWATLATTWVNIVGIVNAGTSAIFISGTQVAAITNINLLVTADIANTTQFAGTMIYRTSA